MPYQYAVFPVADMFRSWAVANLAEQDVTVENMSYAFTMEQYNFDPTKLPIVVIEFNKATRKPLGVNNITLCMPIAIHFAMQRTGETRAEETCSSIMAAMGSALETDFQIQSVWYDGCPSIDSILPSALTFGNNVAMFKNAKSEPTSISLAVGSLYLEVEWQEGLVS